MVAVCRLQSQRRRCEGFDGAVLSEGEEGLGEEVVFKRFVKEREPRAQ